MKRFIFFCLCLITLASCELKSEAESTPILSFSYFVHRDSVGQDTLYAYEKTDNFIYVDTISPLDTVEFVIGADAVFNMLDSLSVTWPQSRMLATFALNEEWFIKERTDIPNGHFKFQPYMAAVAMPMLYIPTASGTDTITVYFRSTTSAYGPTQRTIIQPVR